MMMMMMMMINQILYKKKEKKKFTKCVHYMTGNETELIKFIVFFFLLEFNFYPFPIFMSNILLGKESEELIVGEKMGVINKK